MSLGIFRDAIPRSDGFSINLSCVIQGIQFVLQVLNLSQKADSRWKDSLSVAWRVHRFSIVWLCPFPFSKFFVFPQFLGNLLRDLLEQFCFLYLFLPMASSFLVETDQSIGSSGRAPLTGMQDVDKFFTKSNISISPLTSDNLF